MSSTAPSTHFLSLARRSGLLGPRPGDIYDVTTVAAADYDIDIKSGFMPPAEPIARLTEEFSVWEDVLDAALGKLKLASDLANASDEEKTYISDWRDRVREMPVVSTRRISLDERQLRRAHLTLSYIMHFFVHSARHDPTAPITIPSPIAIPLVSVSRELGLPPILTYADTVLWNWKLNNPPPSPPAPGSGRTRSNSAMLPPNAPSTDISTRTSFTGSPDETHFYMTSAWIELRGVEALSLMRNTLNETFLSDAIAVRRVTNHLTQLVRVIDDITRLILDVRTKCDPAVFFHKIRPWYNGASGHTTMGWYFEGADLSEEEREAWRMLGGPSAGQSSLIHALDVFLGVDHTKSPHTHGGAVSSPSSSSSSHSQPPHTSTTSTSQAKPSSDSTFLARMRQYMPRHHRAFLQNLGTLENPVRAFVQNNASTWVPPRSFAADPELADDTPKAPEEPPLTKAYNSAVDALKRFRDAHIRIVTLYIVTASRNPPPGPGTVSSETRAASPLEEAPDVKKARATGTGGTQVVPFLKGARDNTISTALR